MKFKPTLWKVIITIVVIIIWYFSIFILSQCVCKPCSELRDCARVLVINIIPQGCNCCNCPIQTTISDIFIQLIILLLPGIIVYLIWSLLQNNKLNKKKR